MIDAKAWHRTVLAGGVVAALAGCGSAPVGSPGGPGAGGVPVLSQPVVTTGVRYTCCNLFYPDMSNTYQPVPVNDGNYRYPHLLPAGTEVRLDQPGRNFVSFQAGGRAFRLEQRFGTAEPFADYLNRIFPAESPEAKLAAIPEDTAKLIRAGKVTRGMTREQVLLAIGSPPRHVTTSLDQPIWTYWFGRFDQFQIDFDAAGRVSAMRPLGPSVKTEVFWEGPR